MHMLLPQAQRGFSLVEALIGTVVLAIGFIAIASFQTNLMRSADDAHVRNVATKLIQAKLEDLRGFVQLDSEVGQLAFQDIDDNTGGALPVDTSTSNDATVIANVDYSRTWTVKDYYYFDHDADGVVDLVAEDDPDPNKLPNPLPAYPDHKQVTVTVNWVDRQGNTQSLALDGGINAAAPEKNGMSFADPVLPAPPSAPYIPGMAPNVIPIDLGENMKKETTKPLPDVSQQGSEFSTSVSLDVITYDLAQSFLKLEQFVTVSCRCIYIDSDSTLGRTASKVGWDGYQPTNQLGSIVPKRTGEVLTSGMYGDSQQPELCAVACRDHHDTNAVAAEDARCDPDDSVLKYNCYDPYRPAADYHADGDHKHYWYADPAQPELGLVEVNPTASFAANRIYLEVARFKRIDGILRPFTDWRLHTHTVVPSDFITATDTKDAYTGYVKDYIEAYIQAQSLPAKPSVPTVQLVPGELQQFFTRAIFIDPMEATHLSALHQKISNSEPFLHLVPFYEVNMTKLAEWTSSDEVVTTVTNEPIVDESVWENNYSRGRIRGEYTGDADITALIKRGNSGITGTDAIDLDDGETLNNTIQVSVAGDAIAISGVITRGEQSANLNNITITVSEGGECFYEKLGNQGFYSCTVPPDWDGIITPTKSGHYFVPPSRSYEAVESGISNEDYQLFGL